MPKIRAALETISFGQTRRLTATDFEMLPRQIAAMGFTGNNATLFSKALEAAGS